MLARETEARQRYPIIEGACMGSQKNRRVVAAGEQAAGGASGAPLAERHAFQARVLDHVGDAVIAIDARQHVTYLNPAAEQLYGVRAAEVVGAPLGCIHTHLWLDPGDEARAYAELTSRGEWHGENIHVTRDGRRLHVESTVSALSAEDGGLLAVIRDISARRRAERDAHFLTGLGERLLDLVSPDEIARLVTQRLGERLGVDRCALEEVDTAAGVMVVHPDYAAGLPTMSGRYPLMDAGELRRELDAGRAVALADMLADARTRDVYEAVGGAIGARAVAMVPRAKDGRWVGTLVAAAREPRAWGAEDVALMRSVADLAWLALERSWLYQTAQTALRERDTLFAVAAHDLRTPITVLLGQGQLLLRRAGREGLTERNLRTVQIIVDQTVRLNQMITALLDLARMQEGRLTVTPMPLELGGLLERIVAELQPTLDRHVVALDHGGEPVVVPGDVVRLEQVFQNLIGNAIKYSPAGGAVLVRVDGRDGQALVEVSDRGIGIPSGALPRLFERFYRAENAERSGAGGLGVGLYVVKEILALHGGSIAVASVEGEGTTVTVRLPLLEATAAYGAG